MNCPKCSSKDSVVRIMYGMPGPEMQQDYYDGKIKLGGCGVSENDPDYHCNDCEFEWNKKTKFYYVYVGQLKKDFALSPKARKKNS